jgi:hypothetical protein
VKLTQKVSQINQAYRELQSIQQEILKAFAWAPSTAVHRTRSARRARLLWREGTDPAPLLLLLARRFAGQHGQEPRRVVAQSWQLAFCRTWLARVIPVPALPP